jgi:DNA-binding MarR family transcriptional regulator
MSALGTVGRADGLTLGALAEAECVTPPMATKLANGLAERGLVNRVGCREDGRVVRLEMTRDGRALLRKNQGRRTAWLAERIDALDQTERTQLQDAIEIIERLSRPALVPA